MIDPTPSLMAGDGACPMCRSKALSKLSALAHDADGKARVSVVECDDCTFAWQFPLSRTADESASYFTDAYQGADTGTYFDSDVKSEIARLEIGFVDGLPAAGRRLLDVGAGAGLFARVADAAGWQVTAIDPAIDPARLADTGVRAIRGSLDQIGADETFDVITMWDVIEHVADPSEVVASLIRHLAPGGWLVVETGNYKSADRIAGGLTHWIYQLDHRWYFAPDNMEQLLGRAQLGSFRFAERVLRPGWRGSASYEAPSAARLLRSVLRRPADGVEAWRSHAQLQRAAGWRLAGLPIFCVAARRT